MNEPPPIEPESAALPPPADAAKLKRLRQKARRLWRLNRVRWAMTKIALTLYMVRALYIVFGVVGRPPLWAICLTLICIMPNLFGRKLKARWRETIHELTELAGAQAVEPLIESLEINEEHAFAWEMLAKLLPRLQANDAPLLTPRHHTLLNHELSGKTYIHFVWRTAFIFAVLKAYEQVGGPQDLPTVERLAQGKGYAKRNREIRKAAQACLPYLRARSEVQDLRENLLRASSASADGAATLLRAAAASSETAPRELLRPAEPEASQKRNEA